MDEEEVKRMEADGGIPRFLDIGDIFPDISGKEEEALGALSTPNREIDRPVSMSARFDDLEKSSASSNDGNSRTSVIASPFLAKALMEKAKEAKRLHDENTQLHREKEEAKKGYIERSDVAIYSPGHLVSRFDYEGAPLGRGTFGKVRPCRHLLDRKLYAVKEIKVEEAFADDGSITRMLATAMQEVAHLASLNHANIVGYKECWLEEVRDEPLHVYLYIQMELCETSLLSLTQGRRLPRYVDEDGTFVADNELAWSRDMAAGIQHLHSKGIIHYDLKPANCLITLSGVLKIADFGIARREVESLLSLDEDNLFAGIPHEPLPNGVGTPMYLSPEQEQGLVCGTAIDIFAAGLILIELFDMEFRVFYDWYDLFDQAREGQVPPDTILSATRETFPEMHGLVMKMLSTNPESRPSAAIVHNTIVRMIKQQSNALFVTCKITERLALPVVRVFVRIVRLAGCVRFNPFPAITWNGTNDISFEFDHSVEQEEIVALAETIANEESIDFVRHNGVTYNGSD